MTKRRKSAGQPPEGRRRERRFDTRFAGSHALRD
jgi:hypothetical protein